jgi:hypothetical protein
VSTTATGKSESILMLVTSWLGALTATVERRERRTRASGSAMQAQRKSQQICTLVSSRSVMVR